MQTRVQMQMERLNSRSPKAKVLFSMLSHQLSQKRKLLGNVLSKMCIMLFNTLLLGERTIL